MQTSLVRADVPVVNNSDPYSPAFWRRKLFWIVLIGFLLRVGFVTAAHSYKPNRLEGTFGYGWEMGRIAQSLAEGHGFASPFQKPTGPTAWEPPAYPFLMAGVYKVFGVYTELSIFVLFVINGFFSALTCVPIFCLALRSFGWKIAKWSAWTWSLFPYGMYWAVKWIWETSITLCLLTTLILWAMRLAEGRRLREWIGWGALWGLGALLNPSILSLTPFIGLWILVATRARRQAVVGAGAGSGDHVLGVHHTVAGSQLSRLWTPGIPTHQLWRRTSHGKRTRSQRDVDVLPPSDSKRFGICEIRTNGRTRLRENAEAGSDGLDQGQSGTVRECNLRAHCLLLD